MRARILRHTGCTPVFALPLVIGSILLSGCASLQSSGGGGSDPAPLAVTTMTLPNGQVGTAYSAMLMAKGGKVPYSWSLMNGTLPAGLTLNPATGMISGTPSVVSNGVAMTLQVSDSGNPTQKKPVNLALTVAPANLAIATSSLANGQVSIAYSATLVASGGTSPYTWSITSGALPAGLSLNGATGAITGTPTTAVSSTPLTFQVQDSSSTQQTKTVNLTLTILPPPPAISTTSLPNGQVNVAYSTTLAASGGTPPYHWSVTTGTLPTGLTLNASTGAITGTPTAPVANSSLTFKVTDSGSPTQSAPQTLTLSIVSAMLAISTSSLPNGQLGIAYHATLAASGGTTPLTWSLTSGTLPAGLSLNPSTGAITGTPTAAFSNEPLTFQVQDSETPKQTKTVDLTLTIVPATLAITTASFPNGQINVAYTTTIAASGGTTPYTWSLTSGTLPAGLTLNAATGVISGTPTVSVTNTPLTFQAKDSGTPQQSKSVSLTLTVLPAGLAIDTTSLPGGQVGVAYDSTLAASGGTPPYHWSITSGTLPAGVSLNAATGAITGTPTAAVTNSLVAFKVTDSGSPVQNAPQTLSITIVPAALAITTSSLPSGQVGVAYTTTLAASGGTKPFSWSITSGTLPTGLSLNASTGAITGTPTAAATGTALTFQVQDAGNPIQTKTANLTLTIAPATMTITTSSLPNGQVSVAYNATLAASGGTSPFTWSITSGTLPAGLSLNGSSGVISGTPTAAVSSTPLTFQAQDSGSPKQTKTTNLTLTIAPATLAITTSSLPSGQVGVAYSTTLTASGGTTPYSWSITSGSLPAGLNLNASTGAITGTPTAAVTSKAVTFQAQDSGTPKQTKTANLTLTIAPATLAIITSSLPSGQVGVAYSTSLAASGGTTPYTWSITNGTVPAGLSLNVSTGTITGTPTATVTSTPLTFQVQDSESSKQTKTVSLTLTIAPATLAITTSSLPSGQINVAYSTTLAATGGTTPYTWSLTSGTLPTGLSLNAATGVISGTPTISVTSTPLTFQVKDTGAPQQSKTVSLILTIAPATLAITTTSLPSGQINVAYSTTLAATGGTTPYTWSLTSGTLPAGLSLNTATGVISGTPTVSVTSTSLTFQAKDSGTPQQSKSVSLTLTIAPATLSITTSSLPSGQVGVAYSTSLAATGGTTPYSWSITSGTLPAGLNLNASTGAITGMPTATVTNTSLTFQVQDSETPKQTKTANLTLTVAPATLAITTSALPSGQINVGYSATLAASGGTTPYTWSLTSGTLPTGLSLNAATGVVSGTPTVSIANTPLTFQVQDSGAPQQSKTVNLTLTIGTGGNYTVSISPKRAGLTVTQTMTVTATTNDAAGVTWTAAGSSCSGSACGTFSAGSSLTGVGVTYTAPATAGVYAITATSATDVTVSASITIGVTDLAGVYTWHNNLNRDGSNTQEYALTQALVSTATFGRLFTCTIDAAAYAQPLWVANLSISGVKHNVVYVETQHDTVYAFDADASPCVTIKSVSLLGSNETWLSTSDVNTSDISPSIGIVGTPVIDPSSNTLYLVAKSKSTSGTNYIQRLHALNLTDLSEKTNSPVTIATGGVNSFALIENQRPGLVLSGSSVYVTWASHGDNGPYHGYVYQYDKSSLAQLATFNATPNGSDGGIWMAGAAPAVDGSGNLFMITGNGDFSVANSQYGDSFLKLSSSLSLLDYFTPSDEQSDQSGDQDFGSGGAAILVDSSGGSTPNLAVGGGKDGALYVLNRNNMGHFGDSNAVQHFQPGGSIFSTSAFWQSSLYVGTVGSPIRAFPLNNISQPFGSQTSQTPASFGWPGSTPSISSQGASSGIVWAIENTSPARLHAYDATNLSTELWNSSQSGNDAAGSYVKFTVPTVANGKVYIGNGSQLTVYGLKPN
jgi:Putative Ig domain